MRIFTGFIVSLALILCGCTPSIFYEWQIIDEGFEKRVFMYDSGNIQRTIHVYRIDPEYYSFGVQAAENPKSIQQWQVSTQADMVINGGYFHPDFSASGMLMVDGEKIGERQFDPHRSGLITIQQGKVDIVDLQVYPEALSRDYDDALQSYPFFLKNGVEAITEDSKKLGRRTVLAIGEDGFVYVIVAPFGDLSLYQLMEELVNMPVAFKHALNLDGGSSTGVSINSNNFVEEIHQEAQVPNVLLIRKKDLNRE